MCGTFFVELGHLAFDHSRVDRVAARFDAFLAHLLQQQVIPVFQTHRCRTVALRQARLRNVQTTGERQPVYIDVFFFGSLRHQRPHHVVGQRQGIQLLNDSLGRLAAQVTTQGYRRL